MWVFWSMKYLTEFCQNYFFSSFLSGWLCQWRNDHVPLSSLGCPSPKIDKKRKNERVAFTNWVCRKMNGLDTTQCLINWIPVTHKNDIVIETPTELLIKGWHGHRFTRPKLFFRVHVCLFMAIKSTTSLLVLLYVNYLETSGHYTSRWMLSFADSFLFGKFPNGHFFLYNVSKN